MCREAFGVFYALENGPRAPEQEQSGAENSVLKRGAVEGVAWRYGVRSVGTSVPEIRKREDCENKTSVGVFLKEKH
jgi:hypothetical protein